MSYTFREETVGSYPIRIEASNDDGTSVKEFVVEVVEDAFGGPLRKALSLL